MEIMNPADETSCCFNKTIRGNPQETGNLNNLVKVDDSLLVQELNELSFKEREQIYNEIHGVAALKEETEAFIQTSCQKLQEHLQKVSRKKRRAYDKAVFLKPSLEKDEKLQLCFLRADRYDPARAAHRLCLYFTNKVLLFGEEKLVKDITLDDLDNDDMEALYTSNLIVLEQRDQSGRPILYVDMRYHLAKPWKNMARCWWYKLMNICLEKETQKMGLAQVSYGLGMPGFTPGLMELTRKVVPLLNDALPTRFVCKHICFDNPAFAPVLSMFQMLIGTQNRLRVRYHCGSEVEIRYALLTFGVRLPDSILELEDEGRRAMADQYVSERREFERKQKETEFVPEGVCVLHPGPKDVLLGRGSFCHLFEGNKKMIEVVDDYRKHYLSSDSRAEKTVVAMAIVQRIHDNGGRFLERVEHEGWKLATNERARVKVVHALRDGVKPQRPANLYGFNNQIFERGSKRARLSLEDDSAGESL